MNCEFKVLFIHNNQLTTNTDLFFKKNILIVSAERTDGSFFMSIDLFNVNSSHYNLKTQSLFYQVKYFISVYVNST